jgi:hypothetical protein
LQIIQQCLGAIVGQMIGPSDRLLPPCRDAIGLAIGGTAVQSKYQKYDRASYERSIASEDLH